MHETAAKNLRSAERFLIDPPLAGTFGNASVALCDISGKGARVRHEQKLPTGTKGLVTIPLTSVSAVSLEGLVVWTQKESENGRFVSGLRTYASDETVATLMKHLAASRRTHRIEELRSADRFQLAPSLDALLGTRPILIENLSTRGARIESLSETTIGEKATLHLRSSDLPIQLSVASRVVWSAMKSVSPSGEHTWRAGLQIDEKPEMMRLVVGHLCATNRASLDTQSLGLKLKIMRARARQHAPAFGSASRSGIPAEQYLLIQGVREELRLNPEEAIHWYRRARLVINDPESRAAAAAIADHPDAIAVWEYLDRSIDPSIVERAFRLEEP